MIEIKYHIKDKYIHLVQPIYEEINLRSFLNSDSVELKNIVSKYFELNFNIEEDMKEIEQDLFNQFYNRKSFKWNIKKVKFYIDNHNVSYNTIKKEILKEVLIYILKGYSKSKTKNKGINNFILSIDKMKFYKNEIFDLNEKKKIELNHLCENDKKRVKEFYEDLEKIRVKYLDVSSSNFSKFVSSNFEIPHTQKTLYNIIQDKRF